MKKAFLLFPLLSLLLPSCSLLPGLSSGLSSETSTEPSLDFADGLASWSITDDYYIETRELTTRERWRYGFAGTDVLYSHDGWDGVIQSPFFVLSDNGRVHFRMYCRGCSIRIELLAPGEVLVDSVEASSRFVFGQSFSYVLDGSKHLDEPLVLRITKLGLHDDGEFYLGDLELDSDKASTVSEELLDDRYFYSLGLGHDYGEKEAFHYQSPSIPAYRLLAAKENGDGGYSVYAHGPAGALHPNDTSSLVVYETADFLSYSDPYPVYSAGMNQEEDSSNAPGSLVEENGELVYYYSYLRSSGWFRESAIRKVVLVGGTEPGKPETVLYDSHFTPRNPVLKEGSWHFLSDGWDGDGLSLHSEDGEEKAIAGTEYLGGRSPSHADIGGVDVFVFDGESYSSNELMEGTIGSSIYVPGELDLSGMSFRSHVDPERLFYVLDHGNFTNASVLEIDGKDILFGEIGYIDELDGFDCFGRAMAIPSEVSALPDGRLIQKPFEAFYSLLEEEEGKGTIKGDGTWRSLPWESGQKYLKGTLVLPSEPGIEASFRLARGNERYTHYVETYTREADGRDFYVVGSYAEALQDGTYANVVNRGRTYFRLEREESEIDFELIIDERVVEFFLFGGKEVYRYELPAGDGLCFEYLLPPGARVEGAVTAAVKGVH